MDYNFHTHTFRCRHATGTEREYVEAAIKIGIKDLGFSDHIPFVFPGGIENSHRVPWAERNEYINTVNALKEEYKDRINIYLGFEMEYYEKFFDQMVENARSWGAEFLILGQHSVGDEPGLFFWSIGETENVDYLKEYVNCVVSAIKSGVITYVAHPDIFNFVGDDKVYEEEMTKILKAAEEYNVPLEINFLGIRENRSYPKEKFWKLAKGFDISVVFGFDSHNLEGARDLASLPRALEICEKYGLEKVEKLKLIKP